MIYECPEHGQMFHKDPKCWVCQRILTRIHENKEVAARTPNFKHTRMDVHWSHQDDAESRGRVIHNLEHKPVRFKNKDQFRNYLRHNKIREAG